MSEEETILMLHELNKTAFTCQHLNLTDKLGFNVPFDLINDTEAWCDKCEKILQEEGGWTERAIEHAKIRVCCRCCFEVIKNLN